MRRIAPLLLTSLAWSMVAHAQGSQTSGAIRGLVRSRDGKALAGATLMVRNTETGFTRQLKADADGVYQFSLLPLGSYDVQAVADGHKPSKARVTVLLGQNTVVNMAMEPIEATAVVEITASAAALDTAQVNTFTAVSQKLVESVPLNGRNFTDLVALTPGAVPDNDRISVGGARGIQNNLTIDGASNNSSFFGEQRGSTRIPYAFGADTIQELQVITNAFDAQYNAGGAVINAVTKSGTNEFFGSALVQWRPSSLVAKIRPVPFDNSVGGVTNSETARKREFTQIIGNVNVGGPIIKDKLFFFVGVEQYHYKEDFTPSFATGSGYQAFLTTFRNLVVGDGGRTLSQDSGVIFDPVSGVATPTDSSKYTSDRKNSVIFGRLDWTINENHRATLRVNSQELNWENGTTSLTASAAPTTGYTNQGLEKDNSLSWVVEFNSVFGANLVNEARLQRAIERRPRFANSTASPEFQVSGAFTAGQNNFLPNGLDEFTWQFIDNLTWTSGDWTVKGGIDYQKFDYANTFFRYQNGSFQFGNIRVANLWVTGTAAALTADQDPNRTGIQYPNITYQGSFSDFGGTIAFSGTQTGAYIQGQYQGLFNRRLTLNAGLRFNREGWDDNPRPNPVFQGLDQPPSSNDSLDPRFGFTLDVTGSGKTVIRGGYGEFTIFNPALTVSNTENSNGNTTSTFTIANGATTTTLFQTGAAGVLSYSQRVTNGGTTLTALPQSILRDPTTYGIPTSLLRRTGQIWDPNAKLGKKNLASLGVEQDLGKGFIAGLRAEYSEFKNLQYFVNVNLWQLNADGTPNPNAVYNDGYNPAINRFTNNNGNPYASLPTSRPNRAIVRGRQLDFTGFGDVFLTRFDGKGDYRAIILTLNRKVEQGWGFTSSLTWSKAQDNNSNERTTAGANNDSNSNNPADPLSTFSRSDNDRPFRGVFAGYFPVYFGIQGSAIVTYTSGRPYSSIDNLDTNGDGGFNDYYGGSKRNQFRQPHVKTFDLRFTRDFKITKKFSLEGQIDVFNVLNWANWTTNLNTRQPTATFGYLNQPDRRTREVQLGLRARF